MLTEVHRQAQDDPIVRLSMEIRAGNPLTQGQYGETQVVRRERARPQARARRRPGPGRPQRHAPRIQRAHARAPRLCRAAADGGRQAGLPAQQPAQGTVQRRPLDGEGKPEAAPRRSSGCGSSPTRIWASGLIKVSVRPECFTGAIEEFDWPQRKAYDEFDFGYVLTVHKAQGSQWDDVVLFDESSRSPTAAIAGSIPA